MNKSMNKEKKTILQKEVNAKTMFFGNRYGGFNIATDLLNNKKRITIFSFGIGEDLSFSEAMFQNYDAEIFAFDPTPKSIQYVEKSSLFGNKYFHFRPYGLSNKDEDTFFYLPKNDKHVSGSAYVHESVNELNKVKVKMKRLDTIMDELNCSHIDILKMDIEGSEFDVLPDILCQNIDIDQICIEFHERFFDNGDYLISKTIKYLNAKQYHIVKVSGGTVTFIKKFRLAPVVIFAYNRLEHLKKLVYSLEKCILSNQTEVYFFVDAEEKSAGKIKREVDEVYEFLQLYNRNHTSFSNIHIAKAKTHKGLANSVISGVTEIVNEYKKVIVLEDDLVLSEDFLVYMNEALEYYKRDENIWSISGFTKQLEPLKNCEKDIYFTYRASSWGWGTWYNRWNAVDWRVNDYPFFKCNLLQQYNFNRSGNDMSAMLTAQINGKIDSWAIRWCYEQFKRKMLTVFPCDTKVRNEGFDGSGVHCGKGTLQQGSFIEQYQSTRFEDVYVCKEILNAFKESYGVTDSVWIKRKLFGI